MTDLSLSRKLAILTYLSRGPKTLQQLATHFHTSTDRMSRELHELFVFEIEDRGYYENPVDIDFSEEGADGEVRLIDDTTGMAPSLSLAEVLVIVALIDDLVAAVDADTRLNLLRLRERIAVALGERGYASALWPAPAVNARKVTDVLTAAMRETKMVQLAYLKAGPDLRVVEESVRVVPALISTGSRPRLVAGKNGELRTYRLDRIAAVDVLEESFKISEREALVAAFDDEAAFTGEQVTIRCTSAGRWVTETLPVDSFHEVDGGLEIVLTVRSLAWLRALLVRMGDAVIGVEPERVAREIAAQARRYLEDGLCGSGSC
ncbi:MULTISPECIES: helix-turn-helix transcriptional regulator [Trueperella]|uniref:WYL domain-containing protein n=2 Tax=Actinomycetaceae TaxID=2049 RepID=A0A0W1KLZ4_9ACTO|nr:MULTISPECIES: WYL domain-containing protein [Trueperella]OFS76042.1 hypothetical protein HMPREF3167_01850 [Trueperella sp. HMSC08B05]KTF04996.1 hypothetical protein AQZ59_00303 [Trueperella bernardiae]MCM3906598.1 WYL domain-containing protein [Trueperella bernardiae]MDK8601101.1 WYL domain-containing protein [Trueperella bernardiae]OCW60936.1 hypothetical protein AKG36_00350 [Trueperella bernardiae]